MGTVRMSTIRMSADRMSAARWVPGRDGMGNAVSRAAGDAFALIFRALKLVRPDRPIHPKGTLLAGEVSRESLVLAEHSGITWIDRPGSQAVTARVSRSVGLPGVLPDILGLALRLHGGAHSADILFATTGWSLPARFALLPRRDLRKAAFTTLMPYKGARGPVLLGLKTVYLPGSEPPQTERSQQAGEPPSDAGAQEAGNPPSNVQAQDAGAQPAGEWVLALYFARPLGPWVRFGTLRLRAVTAAVPSSDGQLVPDAPTGMDTSLRFDPVRNVLPGARTYGWSRRMRERSYATARSRPTPPAERETMVTVSRNFFASAADVWNVVADGWLYSGWVVGASRIRDVDALWPGQDAVLHHSVGAWPFLIDDKTLVTSAEPGKSIELIARGWPLGEASVVITIEEQGMGCRVSIAEDAVKGPGAAIPKFIRDRLIAVRNRETLKRLELMASGGAGN